MINSQPILTLAIHRPNNKIMKSQKITVVVFVIVCSWLHFLSDSDFFFVEFIKERSPFNILLPWLFTYHYSQSLPHYCWTPVTLFWIQLRLLQTTSQLFCINNCIWYLINLTEIQTIILMWTVSAANHETNQQNRR